MPEYQAAATRRDFDTADKVLPTVPKEQRTRGPHLLEKQGFRKQALAVSSDPEHRFDLAIQLGDLETACALAKESGSGVHTPAKAAAKAGANSEVEKVARTRGIVEYPDSEFPA